MDGKLRNMTSVYLTGEQGILCLYRMGSRVDKIEWCSSTIFFSQKNTNTTWTYFAYIEYCVRALCQLIYLF